VVWLDAEPATTPGGDLTGLAWRMALAAQAGGWVLRHAITCTAAPDSTTHAGACGVTTAAAAGRTLFLPTGDRH
jgi:hypothetical protein